MSTNVVYFIFIAALLPSIRAKCSESDAFISKYVKWQMSTMETSCQDHRGKVESIAFHARLETSLQNLPTRSTVKFDKIFTNEGNGYNVKTGVFTAPEDGVYSFSWTVVTAKGKTCHTELIRDNMIIAYLYNYATSRFQSASQSAVLKLKSGNNVRVRTHGSYGQYFHNTWSSFSGFKI